MYNASTTERGNAALLCFFCSSQSTAFTSVNINDVYVFSRHFRCQSLGMWEQQFLNDPLTTAQLEAATALGRLPFSPTVVPCLGRGLRNHGAHPLVRSFSALALQRLHNDESCSFTPNCLSALLNYVCTYHYRSVCFFLQYLSCRGC